jgi:tetratricopeptide (TPR) repeat protein
LVAAAGSPADAAQFQKRFDEAARTQDDVQVDQLVAAWKTAEPLNAEVYVAAANYYFGKAHQERVQLSTKPPGERDFPVSDPKSGKVVGSLGGTVEIDSAIAARATDALREATRKFPERLDIRFGLAHIHQALGHFDALYTVLAEAFAYATNHPSQLKWKAGEPLPKEPAKFVPETAQGYLNYYYGRETPDDDERFLRLAKLVAASYPKHPYPVNAIALYYAAKEQWLQALPYLEKAHELDPNDPLVMMNLGALHSKLHESAKARAYYEKVLASDAEQDLRDDARVKLSELK